MSSDLKAQLSWLEEAADACDRATELGDSARHAGLHLRAALGAFVEFTRGPQGPGEQVMLELAVKTLLGSALHSLYGALALSYRELGRTKHPYRAECRELSHLWSALQRGIAKGEPVRPDVFRKLEAIRDKIQEEEI
jgi:hypothetical protein